MNEHSESHDMTVVYFALIVVIFMLAAILYRL